MSHVARAHAQTHRQSRTFIASDVIDPEDTFKAFSPRYLELKNNQPFHISFIYVKGNIEDLAPLLGALDVISFLFLHTKFEVWELPFIPENRKYRPHTLYFVYDISRRRKNVCEPSFVHSAGLKEQTNKKIYNAGSRRKNM